MSDPRVETAIAHWAPKYVEHDVPVVHRHRRANDQIAPADQTHRIADAIAGPGHLQIIEQANHVATNNACPYRPHMADWMADQLKANSEEGGRT